MGQFSMEIIRLIGSLLRGNQHSLAFGLVTPPYGLCLLISAAIGKVSVVKVMPGVLIILAPMLLILLLVIIFPEIALWLPTTLMPDSFK